MPYCISDDELEMLIEISYNRGGKSEIDKLVYFSLCELKRVRKKFKECQDAQSVE